MTLTHARTRLAVWSIGVAVFTTGTINAADSMGINAETGKTKHGKCIVLQHSKDYPPLCYVDKSGHSRGILIDYWKIWSNKTGVPIRFQPALWHECLEAVRSGKADLLPGVFYSVERDKYMDFSRDFMDIKVYVFARHRQKAVHLEDLESHAIGVTRGDQSEAFMKHWHPDLKYRIYDGYECLVAAAVHGEIDAFAMDYPCAMYYLNKYNARDRFAKLHLLYVGKFCAAVKEGNHELLETVNRGIESINADEISGIFEHWSGSPANQWPTWIIPGVLLVAGLLLAGTGVLFFFNLHLRHAVKERTRELTLLNQNLQISIRKNRETSNRFRVSEQRYRSIFENIQDIYFEISEDDTLHEVSPAVEQILQYTREEIMGVLLPDLYVNGEDHAEVLKTVRTRGMISDYEILLHDKSGREVPCAVTARHLPAEGGKGRIVGVLRDIRKRKETEAALIRSEQLANVGILAGGVAHEFNNINTAILGFAELLMGDKTTPAKVMEKIRRIRGAALRAKEITRNLLSFSGTHCDSRRMANLNNVVRDTLGLIKTEFASEGILWEVQLSDIPDTVMDTLQIGQVILNLLINARHALLGRDGDMRIKLQTGAENDTIWLRVTDNGCGIPPAHLSRIFSPFFSTKGPHSEQGSSQSKVSGTGLGLSISHTIVAQHNGRLTVKSNDGHGNEFTMTLPIINEPSGTEPVPEPTPVAHGTGNTIIILDDEEDVRDVLSSMLTRQGYKIRATGNGEQALDWILEGGIDLVLLDLQMPGMSGQTFIEHLQAKGIKPQPAILVVTGQASEAVNRFIAETRPVPATISKPFTMAEICAKVSEILKAHKPGHTN